MSQPSIIVHRGARTIPLDDIDANQSGCLAAIEARWMILRYGGNAKDAAIATYFGFQALVEPATVQAEEQLESTGLPPI
ncbi:hypothetical protein AB0758_45375 [Tolypothrix bouteillei VB521301_2]|uniref:Uncharacterized protein n=1 Tax=Tolypothrix bouteillei VB521301 TaxID=1479485 RepID=A0A0C1RPK0_9CYAN